MQINFQGKKNNLSKLSINRKSNQPYSEDENNPKFKPSLEMKKTLGSDGFSGNFYKELRNKSILNTKQRMEREATLISSYDENSTKALQV